MYKGSIKLNLVACLYLKVYVDELVWEGGELVGEAGDIFAATLRLPLEAVVLFLNLQR